MARLVITHSTYIEGLIPLLKEIAKETGIKSITPGVIYKSKGRASNLKARVSVATTSGFKLIARKGTQVQEVFLVTNFKKEEIDNVLQKAQQKKDLKN